MDLLRHPSLGHSKHHFFFNGWQVAFWGSNICDNNNKTRQNHSNNAIWFCNLFPIWIKIQVNIMIQIPSIAIPHGILNNLGSGNCSLVSLKRFTNKIQKYGQNASEQQQPLYSTNYSHMLKQCAVHTVWNFAGLQQLSNISLKSKLKFPFHHSFHFLGSCLYWYYLEFSAGATDDEEKCQKQKADWTGVGWVLENNFNIC